MTLRTPGLILLLTWLGLVCLVHAASSISFCKCICGSNSTIIQLRDLKHSVPGQDTSDRPVKAGTCNDCSRQFCIQSDLPICMGVEDEKVSTMCFQRDSVKDEAVVYIFILATLGLLLYAAARPWVSQFFGTSSTAANEQQYTSVATDVPS